LLSSGIEKGPAYVSWPKIGGGTNSNNSFFLHKLLIKAQKINVTGPGYEDDVVNDEILELLPVDELLVQAFPFVLRSGDIWEKSVENISDVLKCRLHICRGTFENSCRSSLRITARTCTAILCNSCGGTFAA
jgi:hypothetical protein